MKAHLTSAVLLLAIATGCASTAASPAPARTPKVDIAGAQLPALSEPHATWLLDVVRARAISGDAGTQRWIERFPDRTAALIDAAPRDPTAVELAQRFDASVGPAWRSARVWVESAERTPSLWPLAALAASGVGDSDLLWRALAFRDRVPTDKTSRAIFGERVLGLTIARGDAELALHRAVELESNASETVERERLRKWRALTLLTLGRNGEAELIAVELEAARSPDVAASAIALRASLRAGAGELIPARELYEKALALNAAWPGAARAHADLALIRLQLDERERGTAELNNALTELERRNDWPGLARALLNQAAWFESIDRRTEAGEAERRARALIAQHGLLIE